MGIFDTIIEKLSGMPLNTIRRLEAYTAAKNTLPQANESRLPYLHRFFKAIDAQQTLKEAQDYAIHMPTTIRR